MLYIIKQYIRVSINMILNLLTADNLTFQNINTCNAKTFYFSMFKNII